MRIAPVGRRRPTAMVVLAVVSSLLLATLVTLSADAKGTTSTKPYSAAWIVAGSPVSDLAVSGGINSLTLRLSNLSTNQTFGSANITPPAGYTLTAGTGVVGNTLQLRNLAVLPGTALDVSISVTAPCTGALTAWAAQVKQANDFSGLPGNDFTLSGDPPRTSASGACFVRFVNQPKDTRRTTDTTAPHFIKDGVDSSGNYIQAEIATAVTGGSRVNTSAAICLTLVVPAGGSFVQSATTLLTTSTTATSCAGGKGVSIAAVSGLATFPIYAATNGFYRLQASSSAASNTPNSDPFSISDSIQTCSTSDCIFELQSGGSSSTTTPKKVTDGAVFVASLNPFPVTCDFAPYSYPDDRQPLGVWFKYNGDGTKTIQIFIPKSIVQVTSNNGSSFYRVCFSSPSPFKDIFGNLAPVDATFGGPNAFFGIDTTGALPTTVGVWHTGLLPDCGNAKPAPAPCVVGWTGTSPGDRIGTFIAPAGDPAYR